MKKAQKNLRNGLISSLSLAISATLACTKMHSSKTHSPSGEAVLQNTGSAPRSRADVVSLMAKFWTSVQSLGTVSGRIPPKEFSVPSPVSTRAASGSAGKISGAGKILIQKTPADVTTWSVILRRENATGGEGETTFYLKKKSGRTGPDLHVDRGYEEGSDPDGEGSADIWLEALIADPEFLYAKRFKTIYRTLKYAAWVSRDPDLQQYLAAIEGLAPKQIPLIRPERNEKVVHEVILAEFLGLGLPWAAPEAQWYRQPWLTYQKDLCELGGWEQVRISIVPLSPVVSSGREQGPWRVDINAAFFPFFLPFPISKTGSVYLADGTCSLFKGPVEEKFRPAAPGYHRCIETLLISLVQGSPGENVDNRVRVVDYLRKVSAIYRSH